MDKVIKPVTILNLSGKLIPELSEYFSIKNVIVIDPLENQEVHDWTHIITKDIHDFSLINKTYQVTRKNRKLISLTKVNDLQNFTANNGNMIMDEVWLKGQIGNFILDKYFQSYGGITIGDNYPTFKEVGSFNIANPFNTGEYLDLMIQKAFENGVDALSIKSYFDHLLMYVAGLKSRKKAGLPFEVTYGTYDNIFGVQIHFFSRNLELLDVTTCLSSLISKKPEEYYLNIAVQSSDFFDFSFLPEVNKVIVTGLWTRDQRIKFENRGLVFSSIEGGIPVARYENSGAPSSLELSSINMDDHSEKVNIPSDLTESVNDSLVKGFSETPEDNIIINENYFNENESTQSLSGLKDDDQSFGTVKGTASKNEIDTKVKDNLSDQEELQKIKNWNEEEIQNQVVRGEQIEGEGLSNVRGEDLNVNNISKYKTNPVDVDDDNQYVSGSGSEVESRKILSDKNLDQDANETYDFEGNNLHKNSKNTAQNSKKIKESSITGEYDENLFETSEEDGEENSLEESSFLSSSGNKKNESNKIINSKKSILHNEKTIVKGADEISDDDLNLVTGNFDEFDDNIDSKDPYSDELDEIMDHDQLFKRHRILKDIVQTIQGKFDEDKDSLKISSDQFDLNKVVFWISDNVDKTAVEKDLRLKSLAEKLPPHIKSGLFNYAKQIKKPLERFDVSDIEKFQKQVVPEILRTHLLNLDNSSIDQKEIPVSALQSNLIDQLTSKLQSVNSENERLKTEMKLLNSEVTILKETRNTMARVQMEAIQESSKMNAKIQSGDDDLLRSQFSKKLKDNNVLSKEESENLSGLLEREAALISKLKQEELKVKKMAIESLKKETMFTQELEKSERTIKAKDLMVLKTKETLMKLVDRKNKEVQDYKFRMEQMSKAMLTTADNSISQEVSQVEKQNQALTRQLENYRAKIVDLSENVEKLKKQDNSDELRKLHMQNQQMKNKVDQFTREYQKLKTKNVSDNSLIAQLRNEKIKLEQQLKKATFEAKEGASSTSSANSQINVQQDKEMRRLQLQNQVLETQVKDSSSKIVNLENKLSELLKNQRPAGPVEETSKVKMTQLETSMKKVTQDLSEVKGLLNESKKEANKLRQEKTALQNQLEKLKKDSEKSKSGLKKGGKAA